MILILKRLLDFAFKIVTTIAGKKSKLKVPLQILVGIDLYKMFNFTFS